MREPIKVGTLVAFSNGEYSDYSVNGFARVTKDIDADVWMLMVQECSDSRRFNAGMAVPWFVRNGYVEELEYQELWFGDYGNAPAWGDA